MTSTEMPVRTDPAWLKSRGIEADDTVVQAIFEAAKRTDRMLSDQEVLAIVRAAP